MRLKQELHDRLWQAFQRGQGLRPQGLSKFELKMRGIHTAGDPTRFTRNLLFTGNTLRTYERILRRFIDHIQVERTITRLEEIGKKDFRSFMDRSIERGLAVKTLNTHRSALAKLGALIGKSESFAGLSQKYGWKIQQLAKTGQLRKPTRRTPSQEVLSRVVGVLRARDAKDFARTGQCRAYQLCFRLQMETSARAVSVTERCKLENLLEGNRIRLVSKTGKIQEFEITPELHRVLKLYLTLNRGPLAGLRGYESAYDRAMKAVGGKVTGTHGVRRSSIQGYFGQRYKIAIGQGMSPKQASDNAAGDAIERLGHSRNRIDHRKCYLAK